MGEKEKNRRRALVEDVKEREREREKRKAKRFISSFALTSFALPPFLVFRNFRNCYRKCGRQFEA